MYGDGLHDQKQTVYFQRQRLTSVCVAITLLKKSMPLNSLFALIASERRDLSAWQLRYTPDSCRARREGLPCHLACLCWSGSRSQGPGETVSGCSSETQARGPGRASAPLLPEEVAGGAAVQVPTCALSDETPPPLPMGPWGASPLLPSSLQAPRAPPRCPGLQVPYVGPHRPPRQRLRHTGPVRADKPVPHPGSTEPRGGGQPGPPRRQRGPSTLLPDTCRNQNRKACEHLLSHRGLRREVGAPWPPHTHTAHHRSLSQRQQPPGPLGRPRQGGTLVQVSGGNTAASVSAPMLGPTLPHCTEMLPGGQNRAAGRTPARPE